jgi:6,7-dimethyl-8-ribityllumazine synthase
MQEALTGEFVEFDASLYRVGIVVAQFNKEVCDGLLKSAQTELAKYQVPESNIATYRVGGSIEVPVVLKALAQSKKFDCLVAIGAVIRGATPHFDYVCKIVSEGVLKVTMDYGLPVGFGILTLENKDQAYTRLDSGARAVAAAVQATKIIKQING